MPSLAETQRLLWRLITAPEGVAKALADAADGAAVGDALARTVRATPPLGAVERLDIYANMYFFRLHDVLREDHPAVVAVLGAAGFHNLVTDYLLRHPPAHFSLRHAGDRLPGFVAAHAVAETYPWLAELAALERALRDAFDAPDHPPVASAVLAAIPAEAWAGLRLRLQPSLRLLRGHWAVQRVRESIDRGEPVEPAVEAPTRLCVWRRDLSVFHREVGEEEFAALDLAAQGLPFSDICGVAAGGANDPDLPRRLAAALAGWFSSGCVAAIDSAA